MIQISRRNFLGGAAALVGAGGCRSLGIGADVYWANDATRYQQEKAMEESRDQAIEYLQGLKTQQQMNEAWGYYEPFFGKDKTFKAAFAKRQKEIADGTAK